MASSNTELDEFDLLPDLFAENEDIDWNQLLATPGTTQSTSSRPPPSPEYFEDDSPLDESVLAELDMLDGTHPISTSDYTS